MMILDINEVDARYERKFRTEQLSKEEIEMIIKSNPVLFREEYPERIVNNIYFDSEELNNYLGNIEGDRQRFKVRIRWYGELSRVVKKPILELKIKDGLLGSKLSFPLKQFKLKDGKFMFGDVFSKSDLPDWLKEHLKQLRPSLLNNYRRKYFISSGGKHRITLDDDLRFYPFSSGDFFLKNFEQDEAVIVELKYISSEDCEASLISNQFPFRLTKNSKYVCGIDVLNKFYI